MGYSTGLWGRFGMRVTMIKNQLTLVAPRIHSSNVMAPVYTSVPTPARAIQSPDYSTRDISGETAARPGDLSLHGLPHEKQVAYDGYLSNICAFLFATGTQMKVACDAMYYRVGVETSRLLPLKLPPVVVAPATEPKTETERTKWIESLGREAEPMKFINKQGYLLKDITLPQIQALPTSQINVTVPTPPNATSLSAVRQYLITMKILTLFLATHSYPAFSTDDTSPSLYSLHSSYVARRNRVAATSQMRLNPLERRIPPEELNNYAHDVDFADVDQHWTQNSTNVQVADAVYVAKPAPLRPEINYGPPSAIPSLPGYILPYFPGVMEPNRGELIGVFKRFFICALGDSRSNVVAAWKDWVKGVENWYKTEEGVVITHIFMAVQIALEAQARLFIILDRGKYLGSAILGYKFSVVESYPLFLLECNSLKLAV
jgi:hypothetical protein